MGRRINLDDGVLDSSLWQQPPHVAKVWFTLLALASDGVVEIGFHALARRAVVPQRELAHALNYLLSPDPESRDMRADGRRLMKVAGGFRILNYRRYNPGLTGSGKASLSERVLAKNLEEMSRGAAGPVGAVGADGGHLLPQVDRGSRGDPG